MFILLGIIIACLLLLLLGMKGYSKRNRPPGKVSNYKTRFTLDVWSSHQLDQALTIIKNEWIKEFPGSTKKIDKIFGNVDLYWIPKRWEKNGVITVAEVVSTSEIKLWRGPRIPGSKYKLSYTALPEALIQILAYKIQKIVVDPNDISQSYRTLLGSIKKQLSNEITVANNENNSKRSI